MARSHGKMNLRRYAVLATALTGKKGHVGCCIEMSFGLRALPCRLVSGVECEVARTAFMLLGLVSNAMFVLYCILYMYVSVVDVSCDNIACHVAG